MLSSLEALSAAGAATVSRPGAFQPKVKPRPRRPLKPSEATEASGSGAATAAAETPAPAPSTSQAPELASQASAADTRPPAGTAPVGLEPGTHNPVSQATLGTQLSQNRVTQPVASRSTILGASGAPSTPAAVTPSPNQREQRPGKEVASPAPRNSNVDSAPSCSRDAGESSGQKKRIHSSAPRKRRSSFVDDLEEQDPAKMTMKDLIRIAEAKERKRQKEEAAARKELRSQPAVQVPTERVRERETAAPLAPQVTIVDGKIVINQQSLQIDAGSIQKDDYSSYRRIEETHSKLNYHTHMKKVPRDKWKPEETEMFFKAIQQFGTDFEVIQRFFPTKTRTQIRNKYKKEEKENPRRLTDIILKPREDLSQYEELVNMLKASAAEKPAAENEYGLAWNGAVTSGNEEAAAVGTSEELNEELNNVENNNEEEEFQAEEEGCDEVNGELKEEESPTAVAASASVAVAAAAEDKNPVDKQEAGQSPPSLFAFQSFNNYL